MVGPLEGYVCTQPYSGVFPWSVSSSVAFVSSQVITRCACLSVRVEWVPPDGGDESVLCYFLCCLWSCDAIDRIS